MYAYIKGILSEKHADSLVVEAAGVGYNLIVSARTLQTVGETGNTVKVYTYLNVKEDAMTLFGFARQDERAMFLKIVSVSGIGPKIAMNVLSTMSVADLAVALVTEDVKSITRVPGIGKKSAQRLILELKEKVDNNELKGAMSAEAVPMGGGSMVHEAIQALMALGFTSAEASRAVGNAGDGHDSVESLITAALKQRGAKL